MLGYTFLVSFLSVDPILAPVRASSGAIFGSTFAYIHVVHSFSVASSFYNVFLMSIRAILCIMNLSGTQLTPLCSPSTMVLQI
jgi:hypothetical protein